MTTEKANAQKVTTIRSLSDATHETERWAAAMKKLRKAEADRDAEIRPLIEECERQVAEINKRHEPAIAKLEVKAGEHETRIMAWLNGRTKTTTVDAKNAIADVVVGVKKSARIVTLEKIAELCKKKAVALSSVVTVVLKEADKHLGKKEVDEISTYEQIPTKTVSLKLKD